MLYYTPIRSRMLKFNTFYCEILESSQVFSIKETTKCNFPFLSVAYNADEVIYVWQSPNETAVDYEGKLQLSQFDIVKTAFRGLKYSRGNNSEYTTKLETKNEPTLFCIKPICLKMDLVFKIS